MYRQIDHSGSEFYRADCAAAPLGGKPVSGMGRREFITLVGGAAAAWPLAAPAQQSERVRRIGVLMAYAEGDREGEGFTAAFWEGLQQLGWAEGRNIRIDTRWAAG